MHKLIINLISVILFSLLECIEISKKINDGEVKLVDGTSKTEGTVLVYRGYGWGSICDDHWTINEANVICRQLGMERATNYYKRNYFQTHGIKNYLMDDVYCSGDENQIIECRFRGWGKHDCKSNEHVGVQCFKIPVVKKIQKWNPFNIQLSKDILLKLSKNKFNITVENDSADATAIIITEINGTKYPLCPENFGPPENNVLCRQLYGLYGGLIENLPINKTRYSTSKYLVRLGKCYGNETNIFQCITYANIDGVPCDSINMLRINCTSMLPDIRADYSETERSSYMERLSLWHLQCALSEKCLPDSIFGIIERNPNTYFWMTRNLLRFSSIIENIGNSSFLPFDSPDKWEWHGCHLHYHSMKIFATYEIVDENKNLVATGHKASFCLEDNLCAPDYVPYFRCSNTMYNKGIQGISPGCKDTYLHEYDCQWIDISEIIPGTYTFQMVINPLFSVGETDYFNNGISCTLHYMGYNAILRSCSWKHPFDLL